ncbi:hypothetical protein ACFQRL_02215 [Microbacterium fluvii]|uniref:Uncharacterized protein n=1 Tax=Microbacterium fluvii TaxID=415215 RepID=A0ABW2HBF9_9MICO|nr:hypothetical protein [Microbacterium fluvii]MCU4671405.1 hypothetical protein [Microbacterium fluvii]
MISVRRILVILAVAFTAYLAARGLWWTEPIPYPAIVVTTLGFYLVSTWLCIWWDPGAHDAARHSRQLPVWACVIALADAVIVPSAVAVGVGAASRTESFATWYLGGIGALMTIVMVRRRPWIAWIGIAALGIASMVWMGPPAALALGLVGSVVWVALAQLLVMSTDRAAADTEHLAQLQRAASAWQASQTVRQRERRVQVQRALATAGPVLARTIATSGMLTDAERADARLAEGSLRDELRGGRLLDDVVRAELDAARRRGAHVTMLDEGGLEALDDASLGLIRAELASTLRDASSERLYIRTSPHDSVAVTVVGRSGSGQGLSDEDAVDLWREIALPPRD